MGSAKRWNARDGIKIGKGSETTVSSVLRVMERRTNVGEGTPRRACDTAMVAEAPR